MVSVDLYVNETTRHADVVLPVPSPLERAHYDLALYTFAVRDVANWSEPVLPLPDGALDEWEVLLRLTGAVTGQGPDADVAALDAFVARAMCEREAAGLDPDAVLAALAPRVGPARIVDLLLRTGPYGEGFPALGAPGRGTLSLAALEAAPHGVDLGALRPRLPGLLRTASGKVELAPPMLAADVERLHAALDAPVPDLVLIGRRHLRSNNSWMHNLPSLVSGPARCTLQVHPEDAARLDLADGAPARVSSRAGALEAVVEITGDVRPGVVSLPHGWGHDLPGVELGVAGAHAGVNANVLTDAQEVEPLSGTAILNGIPVEVAPVRAAAGVLA
jgi:anaerobic selenocysteine-containing dehydrogenase